MIPSTASTASTAPAAPSLRAWPLERALFLLAGTMTLLSVVLVATVSPWFLLLTAFVGVNQLAFATVRVCGASFLLTRLFGFRSTIGAR